MCGESDITFVDHTDTIDIERHLNESKVHLNKSRTIEFAKNVYEFLLQQDRYSADNRGNIALGHEKSSTILGVINSILSMTFIMRQVNQFLFFTLAIHLYGIYTS